MAKRVLHKFHMSEISGVDRMAQEGAKMVLMKRDDPTEIAKGAFMDAVAVMEANEAIYELWEELWEADSAMRDAVWMIQSHPERYPDVQSSIVEALGEYTDKVQELAADAAATVPGMGDGMEPEPNDPTNKSDHSEGDNPEKLIPEEDDSMSKNTEPTVETLTADLQAANGKLAKAEAYGKLNDAEKSHYDTLDESGQAEFMKMDTDARKGVLAKAEDANPVVYTSTDGEEFRKNDDPRMVRLAKQADEDRKARHEEIAKRETLELTKRAEDELGNLPGDTDAKVSLLKAVNGIKDEAHRKTINELLKAADTNLAKSFETRGTGEPAVGSAEERLESLAKAHAKEKDLSFAKAYAEVLETDEGKRLYAESQS